MSHTITQENKKEIYVRVCDLSENDRYQLIKNLCRIPEIEESDLIISDSEYSVVVIHKNMDNYKRCQRDDYICERFSVSNNTVIGIQHVIRKK